MSEKCPNDGCCRALVPTTSPDYMNCPHCGFIRIGERAREARTEGLASVEENAGPSFTGRVEAHFHRTFELGDRVTGEQVRLVCEGVGIVPHHHNAWGAAIRRLVVNGSLRDTGQTDSMQTRKSHARRTPVYEVTRPTIGASA